MPARGMRDFLPSDKQKREQAISAIRRVYRSFGYQEIETPVLEDLDRLRGSGGGENLSMIFEVLKRGLEPSVPVLAVDATDLGLRYDLTLPLARFYASHAGVLPSEFRTMQIGPVWRAERPQKGRFRQFTQCDIDIIGVASERAEVELIGVTLLALQAIKMGRVTVRLNDRRLLTALLNAFGFDPEVHAAALISIDKLDKIGIEGVAKELSQRYKGTESAISQLMRFLESIELQRSSDTGFEDVASLLPPSIDRSLIDPLRFIEANVKLGISSAVIRFDPTLVRGMGYYTGPIFEIEVAGMTTSIAGGGRYDGMIGRFGGKDVPACGFSLGFERIVELLSKQQENSSKRLVMFYDEEVSPGVLLRSQVECVERGYEVTAMRSPKKLWKTLEGLAKDGYGSFVELLAGQQFSESQIRSTSNIHHAQLV